MSSRRTAWSTWGAITLIALATLVCFHRLAVNPTHVLVGRQNRGHNDLTNYYIPSRDYAAQTIRDFGEFPFWNPHICLGLPFTGNPQSALFYPPNWLSFAVPAELLMSWLLVAHHVFAGAGVYLLCRRYGMQWLSALAGGMLFAAAPFMIAQAAEGHYGQVTAVSWVPWAFLAFDSLRRREKHGVVAITVCLAMSFLCGHAQETYYLTLILSIFACGAAISLFRRGEKSESGRLILDWTRVGLFTGGLVAIDLVPIFINSRMTMRPNLDQIEGEFGWGAFGLANLQELLSPFALTRPELWEMGTAPFWEKVCFFGVAPLILAAAAPLLARRKSLTWQMAALWLVTLLFAFGTNGPVYTVFAKVVPGMSMFRLPSRVLFFTSFATGMLAAVSIDAMLGWWQSEKRLRLPLSVVLVTAGLCGGWLLLARQLQGSSAVSAVLSPLAVIALTAPVFTAVACAMHKPAVSRVAVSLLLVASVLELGGFAREVTRTAAIQPLTERNPRLAELLESASADQGGRILAVQDVVSDHDAYRSGLRKVRGYDPAGPAGYLLMLHEAHVPGAEPLEPMGFQPVDVAGIRKNVADLLGIELAVRLALEGMTPADEVTGWERTHVANVVEGMRIDGELGEPVRYPCEVFRNPQALPRAFVVGQVREISDYQQFEEQLDGIDFRREVVLDGDVLPQEGDRATFQPAEITAATANHMTVRAQLDAPGYLVLSELSYPGWRARVGDQRLPVLKANMAFRAVPLPAGDHEVVLEFRPPGFVFGALITLVTLLALIFRTIGGRTVQLADAVAGSTTQREAIAQTA